MCENLVNSIFILNMNHKKTKQDNCNLKHKNGGEKVVKKNEMFIFGETNKKWVKYKKCGNSVI